MVKQFDGGSLAPVNAYIHSLTEDAEILLKGDFYGTLRIQNKHNLHLQIQGEAATLHGTKELEVQFECYRGKIYRAKLEETQPIDRAWLSGKALCLARHPNTSPQADTQCYITLAEAKQLLASAKNPETARIRALHRLEWGGNGYRVQKGTGKDFRLDWIGNNNRDDQLKEDCVIVENLFEALDAPCEFYFDVASGWFYVYSETPLTSETLSYATEQTLLEIKNSSAHITFQNLCFTQSDNSMFKGKWERYLRSDWAFNTAACVQIENSRFVSFLDCRFTDLGNTAMQIQKNTQEITIQDCVFSHSLSNGVLIRGDKGSTYCTSSWAGNQHKTALESPKEQGAKTDLYPKQIQIENCLFEDLGQEDLQSAGVCISLAKCVTVSHCTVRHTPRAGINICENAFGGHKILNNDIYDCVRETGDHGPFNSWGRDRFWSLKRFETTGKFGKRKRPYAFFDMLERNEIAGNRVQGTHGFGIDLDDGSSGYDIHHNLCIGVGIKLREGFCRTVENNVLLGAPFDYHCAFAGCEDRITNNIVCCEQPIRVVLENKGSHPQFVHNYHVGSVDTKHPRFTFTNAYTMQQILDGAYAFPDIEPLPKTFGKSGEPEPPIRLPKQTPPAITQKSFGLCLSTVDEAIRTSTGAPNYSGIFLVRCAVYSPLYRLGLRTGDLLLLADEKPLSLATCQTQILAAKKITLWRNQGPKELF